MDLKFDAYDESKELEGVWRKLLNDSSEFLIARSGNEKFRAEVQRLTEELKEKGEVKDDELTNKQLTDVFVKAAAKHILLDWKNVTEDGEPIPYTVENGIRLLSNPKLSDFRSQIVLWSQESEQYKVGRRIELVKG